MNQDLTAVRQQALGLASADRQALIHSLVASLESPELTAVDEAWLEIAEKRLLEMEQGKKTIAGHQFFADIKRDRGWQK